jgi:phosphoribosylformylglycinamidine synthase PurS subunit
LLGARDLPDRVLSVARVIVEVMPKPEILDPQGQAIARALPSLGFDTVTSVRQGKRFEIEVDGDDPLEVADRAAAALLANPVIEDYTVHVAD